MMNKSGRVPCLKAPECFGADPAACLFLLKANKRRQINSLMLTLQSSSCSTKTVRLWFETWVNYDVNRGFFGCCFLFVSQGETVDTAEQKPDYCEMSRLWDSICCCCCCCCSLSQTTALRHLLFPALTLDKNCTAITLILFSRRSEPRWQKLQADSVLRWFQLPQPSAAPLFSQLQSALASAGRTHGPIILSTFHLHVFFSPSASHFIWD